MNAGTAQQVSIVLGLGGILQLGHVTLAITVQLAHQVQRKSHVNLEHTVLDRMKKQHCVPLEHSSQSIPEQVSVTVSIVLQDFIALHLDKQTTLALVRVAHTVQLGHLFLIQWNVLLGFTVPLAVLYPNHVQQGLSQTQQEETIVIHVQMAFTASL